MYNFLYIPVETMQNKSLMRLKFGEVGHILEIKNTKCRRGWTLERLGTHYFRISAEAVRSKPFRNPAASSYFLFSTVP